MQGAASVNPQPKAKPQTTKVVLTQQKLVLDPAIKKICDNTKNPAVCASSIVPYLIKGKTDVVSVLFMQMYAALHTTEEAIKKTDEIGKQTKTTHLAKYLQACKQVYGTSVRDMNEALDILKSGNGYQPVLSLRSAFGEVVDCDDFLTAYDTEPTIIPTISQFNDLIRKMIENAFDIRDMAFPYPPKHFP